MLTVMHADLSISVLCACAVVLLGRLLANPKIPVPPNSNSRRNQVRSGTRTHNNNSHYLDTASMFSNPKQKVWPELSDVVPTVVDPNPPENNAASTSTVPYETSELELLTRERVRSHTDSYYARRAKFLAKGNDGLLQLVQLFWQMLGPVFLVSIWMGFYFAVISYLVPNVLCKDAVRNRQVRPWRNLTVAHCTLITHASTHVAATMQPMQPTNQALIFLESFFLKTKF